MTIARASVMTVLGAVLAAALAGCGGAPAATTPVEPVAASPGQGEPAGGEQVAPETMDEINRSLERKRPIVSHCLAIAVDNKELPRASRGKVTLEIVIAGGKAETVKVVRSTLSSKSLDDCIIKHVRDIQFPTLPKPYETSYTYGFEAM
ncbi:MAG: AgmX/PglI C-terminal domain-containing protein [Kofleriaceae bacterium]